MERLGTIGSIWRYPVKSMAGEPVREAFVGYSGVMGDRVWAFHRVDGTRGFPWQTGRQLPAMLTHRPRFTALQGRALPTDIDASLGLPPGCAPIFPDAAAFAVEVTLPDGRVLPIDSPALAEALSRGGAAVPTLRFTERGHPDCRPVSLFGNASARGLGEALGLALDPRRFRANLYADWQDDRPFREDELVGRTLQVGERLRIAITERDPRCKMITLDPDTGESTPGLLHHVTHARGGAAGVYAAVLLEGIVRQGDPIYLV
jgi:uncharacterized protein YcbX